MRIGGQFNPANDLRVDRSEAKPTSNKDVQPAANQGFARGKGDVAKLRENMAAQPEDRSELVASVKDRVARGEYFTRDSAESLAKAMMQGSDKV